MKRMIMFMLILMLMASGAVVASAAGNGETAYRALLIGVDAYQTDPLTGCVNDAGRMANMLQAANEAGAFYQTPIIRSNLQKSEILSVFDELIEQGIDEDDVTFVYFAGHGYLTDKGTPGIVGKDSQMVSIAELLEQLDQIQGVKVVVIDSRYADKHLDKLSKTDGTMATKIAMYNEAIIAAFSQSVAPSNYYVLAASTLASSAEEAQKPGQEPHGLATYYLTEGCGYDYLEQRPTDELPADTNGNGAVSLSEIKAYIESSIRNLSNATDLVYDIQASPSTSAYPVMARRATAEVLEVTLEQGPIEIPIGRERQLEATTQPANASRHTVYWTSLDLSIASVDDEGVVYGIRPGTTQIAATTSNGLTVMTEVEVKDIRMIEELTLNAASLTLGEDATAKLMLSIFPSDASESVSWTVEDPTVATVDQEGNITCVAMGDTYVTVQSDSGVEATCAIKVISKDEVVQTVEVNKKAIEIFEGENRIIQTRVKPAQALDKTVTFTSSDPAIASISGESIITGVSKGTCTVYATASSGVSAEIAVTVKGASVKLNKDSMQLKPGANAALKVQLKPAALTTAVTWASTDEAVATVDGGNVTAVAEGSCSITASLPNGASATCRVMVGGVVAKNVKISPAKVSLEAGAMHELTVQVRPDNASRASLSWASSDDAVVQVDDTGVLTAVAPGKAVVTVKTISGSKARCAVTVTGATAEGLKVEQGDATLVVGVKGLDTTTLSVDTPVSAGAVELKYASSKPKVASVSKEGVVTAKSPGKAVIRVKAGSAHTDYTVTVVANQTLNKQPIAGEEEQVYTSARQIGYKKGYLIVQLYFVNRTKSAVAVPEEGAIYLTLADGTPMKFMEIKAGKKKLAAGKQGVISYKVKVQEGDALYGLDLRDAAAQLYKPGEEPTTQLPQTELTDPQDAGEADVPVDDDALPEEDDLDDDPLSGDA